MRYDVPLIAQGTGMGCWAASIAMILGWKNQASFDPSRIAANPGGVNYVPSLTNGLNPNDRYILQRNGFAVEEPVCYTPPAITALLESYGPLWLAGMVSLSGVANPVPHIRVVTGFEGGHVYLNDPWPVGRGSQYTSTFQQVFVGQMETLGASELNEPAPIYLAHLATSRPFGSLLSGP